MYHEDLQPWSSEQLEELDACPVCDCQNSKLLESSLVDLMSKPATGPWSIRECLGCGVAYLSPRPDIDSISDAYSHYYTHTSDKDDLVHGVIRSLKDHIAEKYYAVASGSGGFLDGFVYLAIKVIFPLSLYFDAKSRHIFSANRQPGKLLDIGCGNGEFLRFANRFGWDVVGIDFDEKAVAEAKSSGFDIRHGGIDIIGSEERFDFITLSHVIEHVYDPVELIHSCFSLLNDGGVLWLETPNIESMGYVYYRSCWRGLEPPRHVTLFNQASLYEIIESSGFQAIEQKNHGLSGLYMGLASERLLNTLNPCGSKTGCFLRKLIKLMRLVSLELVQLTCKKRREFLTLTAIR